MILEALFNGEIYASENVVPKSDKFREATGEIARIMSFFEDKLSKEDYLKMVIAFCRKPLAGSLMISAKVFCSNHPEEATLPLRCLVTATPLWTCRR